MIPQNLQSIVDAFVEFGRAHGASTLPNETELLVVEVLHGERALWRAFQAGLVLEDEVLDALLDRFRITAFGAVEEGPSSADWGALKADVARSLFPPG